MIRLSLVVCGLLFSGCGAVLPDSGSPTQPATGRSRISITNSVGGSSYYVSASGSDTNDGSAAHPWATIQHAAKSVRSGNMIHVAPGDYSGPITNKTSGTATNRILFVSDTKWGAKIVFSSSAPISGFANFGDYVDIQDFDVSGNGGDGTVGIDQEGSFSRVIGCRVHNIIISGLAGNGGAGIDDSNYSARDDDIIGNVVHDIKATGPNTGTAPHGIYHSNRGGHVWNNISYNNGGWGIHLWHFAKGAVVANNLVFGNQHGGIVVGSDDAPGADFNLIENNIVINNGGTSGYGWGIVEENLNGPHNQYLHNVLNGNIFPGQIATNGIESGNLKTDPLLVNFKADGSGDYHLRPKSPCVKAGLLQGAPPYDFAALTRTIPIDIGPFQN